MIVMDSRTKKLQPINSNAAVVTSLKWKWWSVQISDVDFDDKCGTSRRHAAANGVNRQINGRWMLCSRHRDGLSRVFAAILAKMAPLAVCGKCMCRFRFHETESAWYVRVVSLTLMFVCHGWLVKAAGRLIISCNVNQNAVIWRCNLLCFQPVFVVCMTLRASPPTVTTLSFLVFSPRYPPCV